MPLETVDIGSRPLLGESRSGEAKRGGVRECGAGRRRGKKRQGNNCHLSLNHSLLPAKYILIDFSFGLLSNPSKGMSGVVTTVDDQTGSERLGSWLEVTELLSGRVGILAQG